MGTETLTRNDPLVRSKRFRSELMGDPGKLFGLESGAVKRVYNGSLAVGATTLYTCPIWKRAKSMGGLYLIHNPTAGSISFDFHHVPSGGTAANSNKLASLTVAAGETRTIFVDPTIWHVVMAGDSLVINPGTVGLNAWGLFQEIKEEAATFIGGFVGNIPATATTNALTVPAIRTLVLSSIVGHNYNAGAANVYCYPREAGVAASSANEIMAITGVASGGEFERNRWLHAAFGQGGLVGVWSSVTNVNFWVNAVLL